MTQVEILKSAVREILDKKFNNLKEVGWTFTGFNIARWENRRGDLLGFYFLFNFAVADAAPFTGIFFLTEAFVNAWPGMIVQLVLIPAIVELLYSQKVLQNLLPDYARIFKKKGTENTNTENI